MIVDLQKIKLYAVRHAPTPWNFEGRIQGRQDICVSSSHLRKTKGTFADFSELTDHLVSSPLSRCMQTAESYFPKHRINTDARLSERDYGAIEGKLRSKLKVTGEGNFLCKTKRNWEWAPIGGESNVSILSRVLDFTDSLTSDVIVVTHSGPIQCLVNYSIGRTSGFPAIDHSRIYCFEIYSRNKIVFQGTLEGECREINSEI
jgi:probable phosphoglycerate mutase